MDYQEENIETPKRWSARRKAQIVLRLLRGEPIDDISREIGVPVYRLEEWRDRGLDGITEWLKDRTDSPEAEELSRAKKQIGELSMEIELLRDRCERRAPLARGRSKR